MRLGSALTGSELLAVVALQSCAADLQRTIGSAGATPEAQGRAPAQGAAPEVAPLRALLAHVVLHSSVAQRVRQAVDDDGRLKDSATSELASARSAKSTAEARVRRALQGYGASLRGGSVVAYMDRLCVAVSPYTTLPDGHLLLGRTPDGGQVLVEPSAVVALNTQLETAVQVEREADLAARWALTQGLMTVLPDLDAQLEAVATVDAIAARARHAAALKSVEPQLGGPGSAVVLKQLRHPLLVERIEGPPWETHGRGDGGAGSGHTVVPVDVLVPRGTRVVLVSGPNSGGKTAAAKATALAALASRAGMFVPAASATLPWFDRVLCDIGDEQSLSRGLSTFSGRLARAATLLRASTPRTLLLLDELGAGTAPVDGAALGQALLAEALAVAALTLATSHVGTLKALKYAADNSADDRAVTPQLMAPGAVENAAAEFDTERLAPTYRLLWGVPGRSRALEVAARLGLPSDVLARAKSRLDGVTARVEDTVAELERARGAQLEHEAAAQAALERSASHRAEVDRALKTLDAARDKLLASRAATVGRAAANAQAAITRRKLSATGKGTAAPRAPARRGEDSTAVEAPPPTVASNSKLAGGAQEAPPQPWNPGVGDTVLVARLGGKAAVVTQVSPDGQQITVRAGALQLRVAPDEVLRAPEPAKRAQPSVRARAKALALRKAV